MDKYRELALESAENLPSPVDCTEKRLTRHVTDRSFYTEAKFGRRGEERLGGRYHTLLLEGDVLVAPALFDEVSQALASVLCEYVKRRGNVLVVGLGNPSLVVDALGSETVARLSPQSGKHGSLWSLTPSVYGETGLESATVVRGVVKEVSPDIVIAVDTLATRKSERLCRAVQIGAAGITPGGGVGNRRIALSQETIGRPVLSVGVPLLAHAELCSTLPTGLIVTPKEIDLLVPGFARCIAQGIEAVL